MENKLIAKTLLSIWLGLPDYEEMLASRAVTHALCSFNTPILTEKIMDKIIDLNVKRHTIRNLKASLDVEINSMDESVQKVIKCYYKNYESQNKIIDMANKIGISERSFFRKLDTACDNLANKLASMGINAFTWNYLLKNHGWIRESFIRECQPNRRRNPLRQKE